MTTPPPLALKNSGLATTSLVLGILSLVLMVICIGPLLGIPAVIFGHLALSQIKRAGGMLGGRGLAIAGLVTGYASLALIPFFAAIAIPNFTRARDTAQKNVCINNLRIIDNAKQQWALEKGKSGDDVPTAQDLEQFIPGGFAHLHCPRDGEYVIGKVIERPTCSIPGHELVYGGRSYAPPNPQPFNARISQFSPTNAGMSSEQIREVMNKAKCQQNLLILDNAKRRWASQNHKQPGDVPTEQDLVPFLLAKHMPICPEHGTYEIGAIGENPTCSVPGHQLSQSP